MKPRIVWLLLSIFVLIMSGCQGQIYAEDLQGVTVVNPDLTGKFFFSISFTETDFNYIVQTNNWSEPESGFASMIVYDFLEWTDDRQYTYQYHSEDEKIWLDLSTEFFSPQELADLVPDAESQSDIQAAENKLGEMLFPSTLERYSTPYTEVFKLQNGLGLNGGNSQFKWTYVMPGSVFDTNGTLLSSNQVVWYSSVAQGGANMYVNSAGLTEFTTSWLIDVVNDETAYLSLELNGNKEMLDFAAKLYGEGDTSELIAERIANGLDLPAYTVTSNANGDNLMIRLSMQFDSVDGMISLLERANVLQDAEYFYNPSLFSDSYQFSALLPPSTGEVGYPETVSVNLSMPGVTESNAVLAAGEELTWNSSTSQVVQLSASSKYTNITLIWIIGIVGLLLVTLVGFGMFIFSKVRRSSSKSM